MVWSSGRGTGGFRWLGWYGRLGAGGALVGTVVRLAWSEIARRPACAKREAEVRGERCVWCVRMMCYPHHYVRSFKG